jgi:hypothetical protein
VKHRDFLRKYPRIGLAACCAEAIPAQTERPTSPLDIARRVAHKVLERLGAGDRAGEFSPSFQIVFQRGTIRCVYRATNIEDVSSRGGCRDSGIVVCRATSPDPNTRAPATWLEL